MTRRWGKVVAVALKKSLASLRASENLAILEAAPGRTHHLTGDRRGQFAIRLGKTVRLVFVPSDNPLPELPEGGLDRRRVTRVLIVEVGDSHG
jgi:proteic killer suppression protein